MNLEKVVSGRNWKGFFVGRKGKERAGIYCAKERVHYACMMLNRQTNIY